MPRDIGTMKEQITVLTNNHPPLPASHSNRLNGGTYNGCSNISNTKVKRTDNSSAGNSLETTDRSSTGTNRSSPIESNKHTSHNVNDEHAGRFIRSLVVPRAGRCTVNSTEHNSRLTPPRPRTSFSPTTSIHTNHTHTNLEQERIFCLDETNACPVNSTIMPSSNNQAKPSITNAFSSTPLTVNNGSNNSAKNSSAIFKNRSQQQLTSEIKKSKPPMMEKSTMTGNLIPNVSNPGAIDVVKESQITSNSRSSHPLNNNGLKEENRSTSVGIGSHARQTTLIQNHGSVTVHGVTDPVVQEQTLFEQRLCNENFGVAVRKINQFGKPNLRYVKCISMDEAAAAIRRSGNRSLSTSSASSWGRNSSSHHHSLTTVKEQPEIQSFIAPSSQELITSEPDRLTIHKRWLTWGKKKDILVPLESFVCVRKGKTTDRARKNASPSTRILSLITNDPNHPSLDIEAPTMMDRDKFARAFARFLSVPLEGETLLNARSADMFQSRSSHMSTASNTIDVRPQQHSITAISKSPESIIDDVNPSFTTTQELPSQLNSSQPLQNVPSTADVPDDTEQIEPIQVDGTNNNTSASSAPNDTSKVKTERPEERQATAVICIPVNESVRNGKFLEKEDDLSHISSLTGNGFDHELVEELHHALNELRLELEESRAEASRAVKIAEQAIQSAEKNNSVEWQNTVTHKAAEAAAQAQKMSATSMARARIAEERLEGERRAANYWKKQAEAAEAEAGALQTRAAAAEVQRAAMEEQLKMERRIFQAQLHASKDRFSHNDICQRQALDDALERTRALELELNSTRRDLLTRNDNIDFESETSPGNPRRKRSFRPRRKTAESDELDSKHLLSAGSLSSSSPLQESRDVISDRTDVIVSEKLVQLHAETKQLRREFEMFRRATVDDVQQLPAEAKAWSNQISAIVSTSRSEVVWLQEQLAMECASRRKLMHEVQDLRGTVRVYCRPRPIDVKDKLKVTESNKKEKLQQQLISIPSHDTIVLHPENFPQENEYTGQSSFEYDRVFQPQCSQQDIYTEIEDVCLSVLEGYNVCLMGFGPAGSGKTFTLLGDIQNDSSGGHNVKLQNFGIQILLMKQLFTIAEHRRDRFKDSFSLTIVEVYEERLSDLLVGTSLGEKRGEAISAESKIKRQKSDEENSSPSKAVSKLEIRSNFHGETVVQGLLSVNVESFDEVVHLWEEILTRRQQRLSDQGIDRQQFSESAHILTTLRIKSLNISTGLGSTGKIQFVDLSSLDVIKRQQPSVNDLSTITAVGPKPDWRFTNRSLETLSDVVEAKFQFERSIPYRNSTLTHLLQDSLEGDTKVLFFACISSSSLDVQITATALRFASRIRRLVVGKATKHSFSTSLIREC